MSSRKRTFKRIIQPSVDTYFDYHESDHPNAPTQSSISSPSLPTFLQSSLPDVGMRVRKAVLEGYKTKPSHVIAEHRHLLPPKLRKPGLAFWLDGIGTV